MGALMSDHAVHRSLVELGQIVETEIGLDVTTIQDNIVRHGKVSTGSCDGAGIQYSASPSVLGDEQVESLFAGIELGFFEPLLDVEQNFVDFIGYRAIRMNVKRPGRDRMRE